MAMFARCEGCRAEGPLSEMGSPPHGWITAIERVDGFAPNRDYLACSPDCMAALMVKRAEENGAEPKVKAAPAESK